MFVDIEWDGSVRAISFAKFLRIVAHCERHSHGTAMYNPAASKCLKGSV